MGCRAKLGVDVDWNLNPEQVALRRMVREFAATFPMRSAIEDVADAKDPWSVLVDELGLLAMGVPERFHGVEAAAMDALVVFEALGPSAVAGSHLATMGLAVPVLLSSGDPEAVDLWLPPIVAGDLKATVALSHGHDTDLVASRSTSGEWTVSGRVQSVLDVSRSQLVLVFARDQHGIALVAVDPAGEGVTRPAVECLDPSLDIGSIEFADAPATRIDVEDADLLHQSVRARALVAVSAQAVGAARACLDLGVEYAKVRTQFGAPIGSFQAVKHLLAQLYRDLAGATVLTEEASTALESLSPASLVSAHLAKSRATEAFWSVAAGVIQVHGGIGFTWEHDAHLYFRRATVLKSLWGAPRVHLDVVAAGVIDGSRSV